MPQYKEVTNEIEIPRGVGTEGYLKAISSILQLPKVQEVTLHSNGKIMYRRYVVEGVDDDRPLGVDLSSLMPWSIIRNVSIEEVTPLAEANAAVAVSQLFSACSRDGMSPIAFAGGPVPRFRIWHGQSTGVALPWEEIYGLPYYADEHIPNDVLILCAAFGREGRLIDTRRAYKLSVPPSQQVSK